MTIRYALIWFTLLNATLAVAQPVRLAPTWELELNFEAHFRYHASADLVSYEHADSLMFLDVWTGNPVTKRLKQGDFCFVDSTRTVVQWTNAQGEYFRSYAGSFSTDSLFDTVARFMGLLEHNPFRWQALSSSAANVSFTYEFGGYFIGDDQDQGGAFYYDPFRATNYPIWFNTAHGPRPRISRSGKLCGGVDSGRQIANAWSNDWKVVYSWDRVWYQGAGGSRQMEIKKQTFAWLDDVDDFLIASSGIYKLISSTKPYADDSIVFLRPLPIGWYWHAPFADWTYALACKSDSSQVSIVSLVTDSVVAECTPTSRRIDTIYSDVQRNYIITYDATARVLSGFVVDTTLIPRQVISGVEDDRPGYVVGEGAQSMGLVWPNPARELAHVRIPVGASHITITSALGMTCEFAVPPGTEVVDILLLDFANGVYIVNIRGTSMRQILHIQR